MSRVCPMVCVSDGLCVCSFVPLVVLCVFHLLRFVWMLEQKQTVKGAEPSEVIPQVSKFCFLHFAFWAPTAIRRTPHIADCRRDFTATVE